MVEVRRQRTNELNDLQPLRGYGVGGKLQTGPHLCLHETPLKGCVIYLKKESKLIDSPEVATCATSSREANNIYCKYII